MTATGWSENTQRVFGLNRLRECLLNWLVMDKVEYTEQERLLIEPRPGTAAAVARDFGIDLSLTVSNLRMTPHERVKRLDEFQHEMRLLRQAVLLSKKHGRNSSGTEAVR